jgi:hypothetical protein
MTRSALIAGLALAALAAQAQAAPQPLGLVQTIEPAPLNCDANGKCAAILASFCLQQSRLPPGPGDLYVAAPGTEVRLRVTRAGGAVETVDGARMLRYVSYIGYASITVEIDRAKLAADMTEAVVEVGPLATLLPVVGPDDPKPLTQDEVAMATGIWRQQAEELFDKPNPRSDANRMIARAIGVLPEGYQDDTAAGHEAAWTAALASPGRGFTDGGVALGRKMFAACKTTVAQSIRWPLRRCLENRLEEQQREINQDYWDQQGGV